MKKKIFILIAFVFLQINTVFATDIDILYSRYWQKSINNNSPSQNTIDSFINLLSPTGAFTDINYATNQSVIEHLERLKAFAGAYQSIGNLYYQNATLKSKYFSCLQYWVTLNHNPSNWWFRHIGYLKVFGPAFFLMNVELQAEMPQLFTNSINYLRWAYLQNNYMEGANGADKIYTALPASILIQSNIQIMDYKFKIEQLISIQSLGEGIEQDWMFGQHSQYGRQVYADYGQSFLKATLNTLDLFKGTIYAVSNEKLSILDNHLINGVQWYCYKNRTDPNQTGRRPSSMLNGNLPTNLNLMIGLNSPQNSEIIALQDRIINGENSATYLSGNRMFWRFDYMIHRRQNYYVSSRVTSTRTVGMESGNNEGNFNYYTSAGLNFIFRTGNEYGGNYFDVINYRQWPGTTVEQDAATLPLVNWGNGSANNNSFAGGVSDGMYGAIGTIYDKRNLTARKSWFYFENEFVGLGRGITQSLGTASVFTTINQAVQNGNIVYSQNNSQNTVLTGVGTINVSNPDWILQDQIGYINLHNTSNFKISSELRAGTNVFTLGIDHGINPTNETYAYIVYPNTNVTTINNYVTNLPVQILKNTYNVQSVYHNVLNITQAIFYQGGNNVILNDGKILTANVPCAVMLKKNDSSYEITVANPLCESSNPNSIILTINTELTGNGITWNGGISTIVIPIPQDLNAGQSVSILANYDNTLNSNDEEILDKKTIVYPNPADKSITISSFTSIDLVEIYNINGQLILSEKLNNSPSTLENFDISSLQNGLYIVKLSTSRGFIFKKLNVI